MVVGSPGAGKTALAITLADRLSLPVVHLDTLYWLPGWRAPADDQWRRRMEAAAEGPAWILDGNFAEGFETRMERADTLVWFDYPRMTCLRRVIARAIRERGRYRPDLPAGCPEQLDLPTLRYAWNFQAETRPLIIDGVARFGHHLQVARLTDDRQAAAFLAGVGAA